MFSLKCKHSGYFLQELVVKSGGNDVSFVSSFALDSNVAIKFSCKEKAQDMAGVLNCHGAAKLPESYAFFGITATHVELEVVEL